MMWAAGLPLKMGCRLALSRIIPYTPGKVFCQSAQYAKMTVRSSGAKAMNPFRLVSVASGCSLALYSFARVAECREKLAEMENPWLLVPISKPVPNHSPRSFAMALIAFPWELLSGTWNVIRMTFRCLVMWVRFVPVGILYPLTSRVEALDNLWWRFILWNIQASGPTLIKLGQWASTRRDVFSKQFCDKLSVLHTKTKKKRYFRDCDKVLDQLFGRDVRKNKEKIFPNIHPYSIGSGCIAQVYRMTMDMDEYEKFTGRKIPHLGSGLQEIAIKVADHGVDEQIEMDLSIVRSAAKWSTRIIPSLRYLDLVGAIEQFEMVLRRQVDLRNEARALKKFSENFDASRTGIKFPIVVAYNKDAIAETFEEGIYINKLVAEEHDTELKSKQSTLVRRRIALIGARALLKMIFVDNFVHGDLHPGNILIRFNDDTASLPGVHRAPPAESLMQRAKDFLRDLLHWRAAPRLTFTDSPDMNDEPTLILLDTGIAISETPKNLKNLRSLFRAVVEKKGYEAGELLLSQSPNQNCKEPDRFCRQVEELVLKARSEKSLRTLNISALLSQLFNIVAEHHVSLDSAFTSVILSVMVLEGFGRSLDPDLDLFQCARPYLLNVML